MKANYFFIVCLAISLAILNHSCFALVFNNAEPAKQTKSASDSDLENEKDFSDPTKDTGIIDDVPSQQVDVRSIRVSRDLVARVTKRPTSRPTTRPSKNPTSRPTKSPTHSPTRPITQQPTSSPTQLRKFPSILIFLADDMDYGDVNYNGGYALTPNINALAASQSSLLLDNFHSGSAVCSPSRASLLSGRNPERDCVMGASLGDVGYKFRKSMPSSVRYARNAGYKTAFFGKWHLLRSPALVGYDYWVRSGINVPTWDPGCFCAELKCIGNCYAKGAQCLRIPKKRCASRKTKKCDIGHLADSGDMGAGSWGCTMNEKKNGGKTKTIQFPRNVSAAEYVAQRAMEYLDTIKETESFFIQVHFHEPHRPFFAGYHDREDCFNLKTCTRDIQQFGPNSIVTNFYAVIAVMDREMGRVITKVKEMNRMDDTIIIFASDNGGESPEMGGLPSVGTRLLQGFKRNVTEGGHRVPGIISWPQMIKKNALIIEPTSMLDFFSTLTEIMLEIDPSLGKNEPDPRTDGVSLLPLIKNPTTWTRSRPFGVCMPQTQRQKSICPDYAYFEGNLKVIVEGGDVENAKVYDSIYDKYETKNLMGTLNGLLDMAKRAYDWRNEVFREYNTFCPKNAGR